MAKKKAKSAQAAKLLKKSKSVTKKATKAVSVAAKKSKRVTPPAKKPSKVPVRVTEKKSRVTKQPSRAVVKKPIALSSKAVTPPSKPVAPAPKPVEASKPESSLGRPLVTQEEKLYMLFHDDYQSRQVFEFLQVETLKQLEEFSPQQIVYMMSKPIRMTVDRIRQRLAEYKRSLKDDEHFAVMVQQQTNVK